MRVRLRWGGATDVGQLRSINQDSLLLGPDVFVVADGMGGHQGGEVASAMVIESFASFPPGDSDGEEPSVTDLIERVQDANESVYERSGEDPALSGMGTTVVAIAAVVEDGEERLVIVNVGDSRAYRLSGGQLQQISDDHSLVGEMVRDGRITREQAQSHPQKNIVTRAIGIEPHVDVDDFQLLPHTGDRYLLCSDGLTDEVDERDIAVVLRTIADPDEAARELVRRANEHGGRDNITVVIVDVVDDGGLGAEASAAVPDAEGFSHVRGADTDTFLALPDDQAHVHGDRDATATPVPSRRERMRRPRAVTMRSVLFVIVVAAVIGGGIWAWYQSSRNTYRVVDDRGVVSIVRGSWLWYDESLVERSDLEVDDLTEQSRLRVEDEREFNSVDDADRFVRTLETTTTTTSTTTTTTTTTTAPTATD